MGLSGWEHWLLLKRTQAQFLAPTQQLTATCNSSSRELDTHFWPPQTPSTHIVHIHTCRHIFTYKVNINWNRNSFLCTVSKLESPRKQGKPTCKGGNFVSPGVLVFSCLWQQGPQWTAVDRMLQLMTSWLSVVTCISAWVATSAQRHFSICGIPDVDNVSDRGCEELPHTLPDHLLRSAIVQTTVTVGEFFMLE